MLLSTLFDNKLSSREPVNLEPEFLHRLLDVRCASY
jgi:hypothetical protein